MSRLLKLLFLTLFAEWLSSACGFECPHEVPLNFECRAYGDTQISFDCGKENFSTVSRYWNDDDKYISVLCANPRSDLTLNAVFPEVIPFGDERYVEISLSCPLNENVTVKNYFDRLGITAVTDLLLYGQKSPKFKKEIFAGTTNITKLNLYYNVITRLPSDLFEYLTDLETVELSHNEIHSMPEQLFRKNKKLKRFTLYNNSRNSFMLPAGILSNLPNLEFAYLRHDHITSVSFDLFAESTNLKFISLIWNELETIPDQLFSSQIRLEELSLSGNYLSVIPANLFQNTFELKILELAYNKIASLSATLFENNKKLRKIDLSYNEIESIPDNLLSSLDQLVELYMNNNRIQRLSSDMLPVHITSLDLRKNRLEVIDRNFLIRFKNGLYNNFRFNNNPIKCECSDDLLALDAVSSKIKRFSSYRCGGNATQRVADAVDECKLRSS